MSLKWLLRNIGAVILAIIIIFQEWGWEPLKKVFLLFARWPFWQRFSQWICQLPPYGALAFFVFPLIIDKLVELLGLLAIFYNHPIRGTILIILSKVIGTALIAWVYQLTEHQLLKISWFARFHAWWIPWKNYLVTTVKATPFWQTATKFARNSKQMVMPYLLATKNWISKLF